MAHSSQTQSGYKTFQATAVAIAAFVRVKIDTTGKILVSTAANDYIGITQEAIPASGYGTVQLREAPGTKLITVNGAVTIADVLYPAAAGKASNTASGSSLGLQALTAATADGDIIEAIPAQVPTSAAFTTGNTKRSVSTGVAAAGNSQGTATLLTSDINEVTGADGTKGVELPVAVAGMEIFVSNQVAAVLKVYPNTGAAIDGAGANAAVSQTANKNSVYRAVSATQWYAQLSA